MPKIGTTSHVTARILAIQDKRVTYVSGEIFVTHCLILDFVMYYIPYFVHKHNGIHIKFCSAKD